MLTCMLYRNSDQSCCWDLFELFVSFCGHAAPQCLLVSEECRGGLAGRR